MSKPHRGVRIIGGQWRGSRIDIAAAAAIRPTPDRVRETVFNWLQKKVANAVCLDAFAGSGALGFEAASRGAARVVMIEQDVRAVAALASFSAKVNATQVEIHCDDALSWIAATALRFDLVFVDAPFATELWPRALSLLLEGRLNPEATVYVETPRAAADFDQAWRVLKSATTRETRYALLRQAG
ncbi:MAG: 16S rRNA (guanine(966)-N(2))-methyltransferase RsmD [Gammaproteobacteria bacterium]